VAVDASDRRRVGRLLSSPAARGVSVDDLGRSARQPTHPVRRSSPRRRTALAADVSSTLSRLSRYATSMTTYAYDVIRDGVLE